jgi:hypothetical protein
MVVKITAINRRTALINRNLLLLSALLVCVVMSWSLSAQDKEAGVKKYKAVKGFVEADSVKYPVFVGIREAAMTRFGGITFTVTQKNHKQALLMAEKIKRFYLGKKIGSVSLPQFKKIDRPESIAWNSVKCGDAEGARAVVKVNDKEVTVYLFPSCDEGVLAQVL